MVRAGKVSTMSKKKAKKWVKKHITPEKVCNDFEDKKFSDKMGVVPGYELQGDKMAAQVKDDIVEYARGAGYGKADPNEINRVYDGTHEEARRLPTLGRDIVTMCPVWVQQMAPDLPGALEELLMDGTRVSQFVCAEKLDLCSGY